MNRYGVDVSYFTKELAALSRSLDDRTPDELHRYLLRLADVALPPIRPQKVIKRRKTGMPVCEKYAKCRAHGANGYCGGKDSSKVSQLDCYRHPAAR